MLCPDAGRVNTATIDCRTATIETVVPRYPSAGRAVARFGAAREIYTLYKTGVKQHPLRRRSRLRKTLPCCAEEFDRAHPSMPWEPSFMFYMGYAVSQVWRVRVGRWRWWSVTSNTIRR